MTLRLPATALAAAVALAACGGPAPSPEPTPPADPTGAASVASTASTASPGATLSGQEVVEQICGQCHSMEPPPLAAPPLTHLARHLRQSFATVDEAVAHVVAYAPAPDEERSILPPMAVERFGLMPPQPLPEPLLDAAARYIWSLGDGDDEAMGRGGMGRGPGMRMRRGGGGGSL